MRVLVTGATSMIGDFLLPMLAELNYEIIAISRQTQATVPGVRWIQADLNMADALSDIPGADVWIHLGPIALLPGAIAVHGARLGIRRVMTFSSTSRFTKADAANGYDQMVVDSLVQGEARVEQACMECAIGWTIFRPTLIYCFGRDKNLTLIRDFIARFSFFPLIGAGKGMRQPVHAADLAQACIQAIKSDCSLNHAYDLSGGEIIAYRDMVARIFHLLGKQPRFMPVPLSLMRAAILVMRLLPRFHYLTPDMANRTGQDMVFSHANAHEDFGYAPGKFQL